VPLPRVRFRGGPFPGHEVGRGKQMPENEKQATEIHSCPRCGAANYTQGDGFRVACHGCERPFTPL